MKKYFIVLGVLIALFFVANEVVAADLSIVDDFMSTSAWGTKLEPPVYASGNKVYYHAFVAGLEPKSDGKYSVRCDLLILGPDGKVFRWAPGLIVDNNLDKNVFKNNLLPLRMHIEMLAANPAGEYTFVMLADDLVSGKKGAISKTYQFKK